MVTFLEIGLLENFSIIFPALLIFVIVFALLQRYKLLGENITINALIAIAIAFITMLSQDVVNLISFMAPWFVMFFIFLILMLAFWKIMGATDESIANYLLQDKTINWTLFTIGLIIIIAAFANVYGQRLLPETREKIAEEGVITEGEEIEEDVSFATNVHKIFFHPKVLGLLLILFIAVFTIGIITKEGMA